MADLAVRGLSPRQRAVIVHALAPVFTKEEFEQLLSFQLSRDPGDFFSSSDSTAEAIEKVLIEADKGRWWQAVLYQARCARPESDKLQEIDDILSRPEKLHEKQIERLSNFLNDIFTRKSFSDFLAYRLNKDLNEYASRQDTDLVAIRKVIQSANDASYPWWSLLLTEARNVRPEEAYLLAFQQEVGQGSQLLRSEDGKTADQSPRDPLLPLDVHLLGEIESRICSIECPEGVPKGSGFLIANDLVLTNYHVVMEAVENREDKHQFVVRFDSKTTADGVSINPGKVYPLVERDWIVDSSPLSPSDVLANPISDPNDDELDYALLRVAGSPGQDPVGGNTRDSNSTRRGFIELPRYPHDFMANRALYIAQVTNNGPMKIIVNQNAVVSLNDAENRISYTTKTYPGSSGAPCFSDEWNCVALHHGGDPEYPQLYSGQRYNRGVPITKIIERLRRQDKLHLIEPEPPIAAGPTEVIILGSPSGDLTEQVSSAVDDLKARLDRSGIHHIALDDKWAEDGKHPELSGFADSQTKPILVQPVDSAVAAYYRLTPDLLKRHVEISAGTPINGFRYIVWLPEKLDDIKFAPVEPDLWLSHGPAAEVSKFIERLMGRDLAPMPERHPAFGYQKIQSRQRNSANIIRDVIIPEISAPLRPRYAPPEWESVFFSKEEDAKKIIQDLKNYPFSIISINNFNGQIDHDGDIPEEFKDRLITFDKLIKDCSPDDGVRINNILMLGIIATTQPEKHLFRYLSGGAHGIISRWRFLAVGIEGDSQLQVKADHLESLCEELQDRMDNAEERVPQ